MTLLERIVRSPRLPQYVRELEGILEAEREKRQQFFEELREDQKAEFINGEVVVQSPVRFDHGDASGNIYSLMKAYVRHHSLGFVGHEKMLVSLTRNDYEPDICFWGTTKSRKFKARQMKFPAPNLVVEVLSRSTERIDRTVKFEDYAAHKVSEYWIVDPRKRTIEQYLLNGNEYELALKVKDGTVRSRAIKGFEMPARAAFDAQENQRALARIVSAK